MAKKTINVGTQANDGSGDPLRTAFQKINDNFDELFGDGSTVITLGSPQITTPTITGIATIDNLIFNDSEISTATNANLELNPGGAGTIELKANTNVTGALDVTGAATLDTSLTLATGATITEFSTNTALGTSNTVVPTQNAVKTYVDTQLTASNLPFAGDTGGTLNIDLDSETLTIAGGTGIDTSGSGNTLTVAIDSSVVTLTGSQVLTNKTLTTPTINGATMTGNVTVDNLIFNDSEISTDTNANLNLNPGGTGTIELQANTNVTGTFSASGNTSISGTLSTADITTTGSHTLTGNITVAGEVRTDKIKSPATNANIEIAAQGTGVVDIQSAMTTVGQTIAGTASITSGGQLNVGNLNVNGDTISGSGNILLNANAGAGQITLTATTVSTSAIAVTNLSVTTATVSSNITIQGTTTTDRIQTASNADLVLDPQGTGTVNFALPTTTAGAGSGQADISSVATYLKVKINGTEYAIPAYAINP